MLDKVLNLATNSMAAASRWAGGQNQPATTAPYSGYHRDEHSGEPRTSHIPSPEHRSRIPQPVDMRNFQQPTVIHANGQYDSQWRNRESHGYDDYRTTTRRSSGDRRHLQDLLQERDMELRSYREDRERLLAVMDSKDRDLAESHRREARSNKEREDWRMLAEARQRKLEEAQTFLESSDVTAENDIAEAVSALNAEIYQVIKRVPEGCRISTGSTVDIVATDRAGTIIGSRMMDLIRTFPPRGGDWVVMEIALQATITAYVARVISSWSPHCSSDEVIDPIYNRILRSESQSVAGRWRILTRKYVVSSSTSIKDWETRHVRQLLEDASTILGASGAISWDNNDLKDGLEIIVHAAMKIRRMVGEDVVRSEYEVFAVKRKANFDPDVMVDEYASPQKRKKKAGVHVICPLTLGLRRREGENRSGTKGRSEVTVKTLVKPQVVLDTVIDDLGFLDDRE